MHTHTRRGAFAQGRSCTPYSEHVCGKAPLTKKLRNDSPYKVRSMRARNAEQEDRASAALARGKERDRQMSWLERRLQEVGSSASPLQYLPKDILYTCQIKAELVGARRETCLVNILVKLVCPPGNPRPNSFGSRHKSDWTEAVIFREYSFTLTPYAWRRCARCLRGKRPRPRSA